jgi:plastocyanin
MQHLVSRVAVGSWLMAGACAFACPSRTMAQGTVAGQVSITERAGDITDDLGNAVVTLEQIGAARPRLAPMRGQMAMERRRFSPGIVVVTPGSSVDFPNRDGFDHNIFTNEKGFEFDAGQYGRGETYGVTFRVPGVVPVYCNIHSRMVGHVFIAATMHVAQAGADGRWSIPRVPAGKYVLRVWHARTPPQERELLVTAAGAEAGATPLDARGFKFKQHQNKFGQDYKAAGERY